MTGGNNTWRNSVAGVVIAALAGLASGCDCWWPVVPDPNVVINVQVDAEGDDTEGIQRVVAALRERNIPTTVFVTADWANKNAPLVQQFYRDGCEIALHGYYTGEQLASMTYEEQKDLLSRAMLAVQGCQPCGTYKQVTGFRPQYFSQNEDTYRVLDELGLAYNAGYKAGQLDVPGHEDAVTPFQMPGHEFFASPITVAPHEGEDVYLCDISCALAHEMTGAQWLELLRAGRAQCAADDVPMVVLVHGWYTGDASEYDFWQPLLTFLDENRTTAEFITTAELVERYEPAE